MPFEIRDGGSAGTIERTASGMKLPASVPVVSLEQVRACCHRSPAAAALRRELDAKIASGKSLSKVEVEALVKRASARGRLKDNHAVVIAYYAQNHAHCFAK